MDDEVRLREGMLSARIQEIVDAAPPLSEERRQRLRFLLGTDTRQPHFGPIPATTRPVIVQKVALYRHFDAAGVLLYVGVSSDPRSRSYSHRRHSAWTEFAVREEVEWLPDRDAALVAEKAAIVSEKPLFNGVHTTPDAVRAGVDYLIRKGRTDLLRFGGAS